MKRQSSQGFTLVELLLAVTLMATLLALAYSGLRAATTASERGQQMLEESGRLRISHQFIRRQFNLMLPLAFRTDEEDRRQRFVFEGAENLVVFVGPMPGYLARGGPQVQMLELVPGDKGLTLQFVHAPLQEFELERLRERDPVILLEGLAGGYFEFLEVDEEEQPLGWVGAWPTPGVLPSSVRLMLEFDETARVDWPVLVAAPRLDEQLATSGVGGSANYADAIRRMIRGANDRGEN